MASSARRCLCGVCIALAWLLPACVGAADGQQLERLNVGDFRLYYTRNSPGKIHYRGAPLIEGMYVYSAVKTETRGYIEGFNFHRGEEGLLTFAKEATDDGHRLIWRNKRYIYKSATQRTDQVAGEAEVMLTLSPGEVSVRYRGTIEPNVGFGEIGFYVPEEALSGGGEASWTATLADETTTEGTFPRPDDGQRNIVSGLTGLTVEAPRRTFEFGFEGQAFPGSHGQHFQDFRKRDQHSGCYRFVVNFNTAEGNEFDYTWRLALRSEETGAADERATDAPDPALLPRVPARPVGEQPFGDAQVVPPRATPPSDGPGLQATVSDAGQIALSDGGQPIIERDYFSVFTVGAPAREESRVGDIQRITLSYDAPAGELVKELIASPDEAWVMWTVRAREQVRGEVGFYCPEAAFRPPFICYRSVNQPMVEEHEDLELSSTYCIVSGGEGDFREWQCGTSRGPDWIFQDHRATRGAYRFVAVPRLDEGAEWRAVFRYVRSGGEGYPPVSFDQAREERGILSTLLPDAMTAGFTVVPARSAKYAWPGRPIAVTMKYHAVDRTERDVEIACRLTDMWGRQVGERTYRLASAGARFAALRFPVTLGLSGAYRMDITCRSGDVTLTRELVLTVLPEVADTGFRPGSVFGAALGRGDYLGTLAQRIGLKWNRCHCAIGDTQAGCVQAERGQFTWDGIERACEFHDKYQFLGCHSISEGWRAPWLKALFREEDFEEYREAFVEEYVKPLATRFKGQIKCWEVTNEPYYQYRNHPEHWVALMKATYEALKEIDPECTVVGTCGPPGSMGYSWYRRTFELGSLEYQDAVSSHLYHFGPWVGSGVALTVRKWMREIRAIMSEHGRVLPLWNSETTVSPPASMYRHPSHTRYVRYHPGESATDPIEQAQIYFKVLVIHKAEDVKYSFHIFHGGVEYTSHTGEYDETPLSMLATQAALAKHLEEAEYVGDLDLHGDIQVCVFRRGNGLVIVPWGPMFLKRDSARVALPIPAGRFTARDIFDNPLPVAGDAEGTDLLVTWEGFFLLAEDMSIEELTQAAKAARVSVHFSDDQQARVTGTFHGEGAGPAKRGDWVGFHAVDLCAAANRGFRDETPADGLGGWTDEGENDMRSLPPGEWVINGVPFRIIDPEDNGGRSCVILKGGMEPDAPFPEHATIPVGKRLSKLHFLHTVTWGSSSGQAFRYVLHYRDGVTEEVPVSNRVNVADWWWLGELPEARVAWEGPNPVRETVRLYHAEHETTHPGGAQAVLDRIEIVSEGARSIPVIIAITGVYSN